MVHRPINSVWRYVASGNQVRVTENTRAETNTVEYISIETGDYAVGEIATNRPLYDFQVVEVIPPQPEQFLIFNATSNRVFSHHTPRRDWVTREEGLAIMHAAMSIDSQRVLHLIPLRSVTKVDISGTEVYENNV